MGETSNGYELLRRLAAGGMGEVFVARKTGAADFEKRVALKLLLPHLTASPEAVERFYAEARLAARMHHPNIVEIFDVGEAEGRPFLAMQLVEGVSLSQHLRHLSAQRLTVPLPIVRAVALGVCEALAYAHTLTDAKGKPLKLVHRDVTPSNILLSFTGAVQLTDFGIARVGEVGTRTGVLQGKAAYIAPEQLTHEAPLDARADLYSAAVTLYELVAGVNPFRRDTHEDTFKAVLAGQPPPLRTLRPDVTPQLEAALHKAIARRPGERFPDAVSLRKAVLDGPVASAPELAEHVRLAAAPLLAGSLAEDGPHAAGTRSQVLRVTASVSAETPPAAAIAGQERWPPRWTVLAAAALSAVIVAGLAAGVRARTGSASTDTVAAEPQRALSPAPEPGDFLMPELEIAAGLEAGAGKDSADSEEPRADTLGTSSRAPESDRRRVRPGKPGRAARPPAPASVKIGYLTADAVPWAEVLVDGAVIDRTPFSAYPLPVGRHAVTFRAPDGQTEVRAVSIREGETSSVRVEFARRP